MHGNGFVVLSPRAQFENFKTRMQELYEVELRAMMGGPGRVER